MSDEEYVVTSSNSGGHQHHHSTEQKDDITKDTMIRLVRKMQHIRSLNGNTQLRNEQMKFDFPQIVAIGGQSHGKSSVLESIVGLEFLPRDVDMATRCPLVLNLINDPQVTTGYFVFGDNPEKITDPQKVCNLIKNRTDAIAKEYKSISNEKITVTYTSNSVVDLQLVDLPGYIAITDTNQKESVKDEIVKLADEFIRDENTLILAIQAADDHIQNSIALEKAKRVDPHSRRTIGVLTKVDRLRTTVEDRPKIEAITKLLANEKMPLERGYFLVVNRSETQKSETVKKIREQEKNTLLSLFDSSFSAQLGIESLSLYLFREFAKAIDQKIPKAKNEAKKALEKIEGQLTYYGHNEDVTQATQTVMITVEEYSRRVVTALTGNDKSVRDDMIDLGAVFLTKLHDAIANACEDVVNFDDKAVKQRIATSLDNLHAAYNGFLLNETVFHKLIEDLTGMFVKPFMDVIDSMTEVLNNGLGDIMQQILQSFPILQKHIATIVFETVESIQQTCRKDMEKHIRIHQNLVNIKHPDFQDIKGQLDGDVNNNVIEISPLGSESAIQTIANVVPGGGSIAAVATKTAEAAVDLVKTAKEKLSVPCIPVPTRRQDQTEFVYDMVIKYMRIIEKIMRDYGVKSIHYHLVTQVKEFHAFKSLWLKLGNPNQDMSVNLIAPDDVIRRRIDDLLRKKEDIQQILETLEF